MLKHYGTRRQCEYCTKSFSHRRGLEMHLCEHTGQYPYNCDFCKRGFTRKGYYEKHMLSCLGPEEEED